MSDKYFALTVFLEGETDSEDVDPIITAINMVKGVRATEPVVAEQFVRWAKETAKDELRNELFKVLSPEWYKPVVGGEHKL